jgi:hypothetical protein
MKLYYKIIPTLSDLIVSTDRRQSASNKIAIITILSATFDAIEDSCCLVPAAATIRFLPDSKNPTAADAWS